MCNEFLYLYCDAKFKVIYILSTSISVLDRYVEKYTIVYRLLMYFVGGSLAYVSNVVCMYVKNTCV